MEESGQAPCSSQIVEEVIMSWQDEINEIQRQSRMAEQMGGEESIAFHHGRGKLTVRERIDLLQDPASLEEIGTLAGSPDWQGRS